MTDGMLIEQLSRAFSGLSAGISIVEGLPEESRERLLLPLPRYGLTLTVPAETPGAEDILRIAGRLAQVIFHDKNAESAEDCYRRIMLGECSGKQIDTAAGEYRLQDNKHRCLMLFRCVEPLERRCAELICDMIPLEGRDVLIGIDRQNTVLIRELGQEQTTEEQLQFGMAVQETAMAEMAMKLRVGISRGFSTLQQMAGCYAEAQQALEVGSVFIPQKGVYAYEKLLLERFLLSIPPDVRKKFCGMLSDSRSNRLLNEEMMGTIDMFFQKDLNMSDTARQLFIHRNTLVYRLEKIQKLTGLDLRSFRDAMIFKLLMQLQRCTDA